MPYRARSTGQYPFSRADLIAAHPRASLPATWDAAVLNYLDVDEVFVTPMPAAPIGGSVREKAPVKTAKGTWEQAWEVVQPTADQTTAVTESLRASRLAELAQRRWQAETGGITLAGARISTDRESQALVNGALGLVTADPSKVIDWKAGSGWVQLDAAMIQAVAFSVGSHVQACFSRERVLAEQLADATTIEAIAAVDIATGWPGGA